MDSTRFLSLAEVIATFSKDPSTKVGAIIIDDDNNVLAMGYNGLPRNVVDSDERLCNRELKYQMVVHAEMNALLASARTGRRTQGATLLVSSLEPCAGCAAAMIQAGIKKVVCRKTNNDRWAESNKLARDMLAEAGVILDYV